MKTKNLVSLLFLILSGVMFAMGNVVAGISLATVPAAGTFDCSNILEILGKSDQMWVDNATKKNYVPKVEALRAIVENQTAQIQPISGQQEKNNSMKITWLNACDIEGEDVTDKCTIRTGTQLSTNCQTISPTLEKSFDFSVAEDTLRDNIFSPDEVIAKGMLNAIKNADEYFAKQVALFLDTHKGHNNYQGIGAITGSGVGVEETIIAPAYWNAALMGEFVLSAEVNKYANPILISGSNLRKEFWAAQANAANADGKGNLNMFDEMPIYFDTVNVDGQLSPDKMTFLVDKGAVAFGARWNYGTTPTQYTSQIRYSVASKAFPSLISYDVYYDNACINGKMTHRFNLYAVGGIYLNPVGCTETENGIIAYKNA